MGSRKIQGEYIDIVALNEFLRESRQSQESLDSDWLDSFEFSVPVPITAVFRLGDTQKVQKQK